MAGWPSSGRFRSNNFGGHFLVGLAVRFGRFFPAKQRNAESARKVVKKAQSPVREDRFKLLLSSFTFLACGFFTVIVRLQRFGVFCPFFRAMACAQFRPLLPKYWLSGHFRVLGLKEETLVYQP